MVEVFMEPLLVSLDGLGVEKEGRRKQARKSNYGQFTFL